MLGQTNEKIRAEQRQRALRNHPTDAESRLWRHLRRRQIDNCKFRRQHPFGGFILDFACVERKVAIELDGGQHFSATGYDEKRSRFLERAGYVVLRFWNNEVFENMEGVLEVILRTALERANPIPTPALPLKGREKTSQLPQVITLHSPASPSRGARKHLNCRK
jgi:adenine-specific DNA-methyltransferase